MICFIMKYKELVPSVFFTRIKLKNFNFIQQHIQLNIFLFTKKVAFLAFTRKFSAELDYIEKSCKYNKSRIVKTHNSAFYYNNLF
jgi:hypothetical protein